MGLTPDLPPAGGFVRFKALEKVMLAVIISRVVAVPYMGLWPYLIICVPQQATPLTNGHLMWGHVLEGGERVEGMVTIL